MAKASEGFKNQLVRRAEAPMPSDMNTVENQRQVLYMVETVAPMVSACRKHAEETLWPKVSSGELTIQEARKQCGLYLNKLASITIVENLKLDRHSKDNLLKAWGAMNSYAKLLKPEESVKLCGLMDAVAAVLEEKETGKRQSVQQPADMDMSTVPIDTSKIVIPELKKTGDKPEKKTEEEKSDYSDFTGVNEKRKGNPTVRIVAAVLVAVIAVVGIVIGWQQTRINNVEEAITEIGQVSMESSGAIKNAELAYDDLSDSQKEKVENYDILEDARAEFDRLDSLVKDAEEAIDAIGEVTLSSGPKIDKARKAYDALEPDNLTEYAEDKYKTLTDAEAEYRSIHGEDLYNTGVELFEQEKYDEALPKFSEVVEEYPDHERAESARAYGGKCMVIKAQASYDNSEYESAMNLLAEGREKYGESAENTELSEKLLKKLDAIRPINGKKFNESIAWGYGKLNVIANDQDVVVKVVSETDPEKYTLFYVHAGSSFEISLENGDYKVYYGTGEHWYGEKEGFGQSGVYKQVNKTFSYTSERKGSYVYYNARKLDLTGKVSAADMTYEEFWNQQ